MSWRCLARPISYAGQSHEHAINCARVQRFAAAGQALGQATSQKGCVVTNNAPGRWKPTAREREAAGSCADRNDAKQCGEAISRPAEIPPVSDARHHQDQARGKKRAHISVRANVLHANPNA